MRAKSYGLNYLPKNTIKSIIFLIEQEGVLYYSWNA